MFKLGIIASAFRAVAALLLDTYPNASAAYSLRKLRTAYSGSAVRVRRSIDNTEQDIGFDGSGNLNTSALQTFVGYQNLMIQSQTFNTSWTGINQTITLNATTDPIGGNTGNRMNETSANGVHFFFQSAGSSTGLCTISVYAKKFTRDWIRISEDGGTGKIAWFNINLGTIGTVQTGFQNAQIQNVGNGWYRCSVQITNKTGTGNFAIGSATANGVESFVGSASDGIYVWGAQFNTGSLQPYQQTTTVANTANGFVTTWYDQSTNAVNAVQATAARQPSIVSSGIIQTKNGKTSLKFTAASLTNLAMPYFADPSANWGVFTVYSIDNVASNNYVSGTDGFGFTTNGMYLALQQIAFNRRSFSVNSQSTALVSNTLASINHLYLSNNTASSSTNGVATPFASMLMSGNPFTKGQIAINTGNYLIGVSVANSGELSSTYSLNGNISEIVTYRNNQSANRVGIEQNINSFYQIYWNGSQNGLLNTYPNAAAAYSLRNLSSTYTGALIRVRRSSDNTELDIYGTYQGNLDTATLLSFVGAGNGFVTTWYDQSSNGRNLIQATASNQPIIVFNGVIETQGGAYAAYFNGTSQVLATSANATWLSNTAYSVFAFETPVVKVDNYFFGSSYAGTTTNNAIIIGYRSTTQTTIAHYNNDANFSFTQTAVKRLHSIFFKNTGSEYYINSASLGTLSQPTAAATVNNTIQMGRALTSLFYNGRISEMVVYASNQLTNRVGIESNINSYYSIY